MAKRIQLKRTKGWRKPEGAVVVSRPTKWGNPFNWQASVCDCIPEKVAKSYAVEAFEGWINGNCPADGTGEYAKERQWILEHIHELCGKDLCCWCKPDDPCHADILLELANKPLELQEAQ